MQRSRHRRTTSGLLPAVLRDRRLLLVAPAVTLIVGAGVAVVTLDPIEQPNAAAGIVSMGSVDRESPVSRDSERTAAPTSTPTATPTATPVTTPTPTATPVPTATVAPTPVPAPTAVGEKFTTAELNVRVGPDDAAEVLTVLETGATVAVTGAVEETWAQILYDGAPVWVSAEYLADTPPEPEDTGISAAACESGSGVEDGLTPDAIRVHRAVCAKFPEVGSYGGLRSGDGGEHGDGRALDIMISDKSVGDAIADFVRENREVLGVSEVIWWQQIWTVERGGDGWRSMSDRGSDTANHYDHVHVTVYGNDGSS